MGDDVMAEGAMARDDEAVPVFGVDGHLDEAAAHAFIDGALDDEDAARVVLHVAACARCAALVADARGLAAAAAGIVRRLDDGPGAIAILPMQTPTDVVAASARPTVRPRRAFGAGLRAAAAALVAVGIGGGAYVASRRAPERTAAVAAAPVEETPTSVAVGAGESRALVAPTAAPSATSEAAPPTAARPTPAAPIAAPTTEAPSVVAAAPASPPAPPARVDLDRAAPALAPMRRTAPGVADANGVVVGQVRDAASRPLAGTTVVVAGTTLSATSDDSGRFVLRGVPAGAATLRASRSGFGVGTATVAVGSADTTRATFQLDARPVNVEQVTTTGAAGASSDAARAGASGAAVGGPMRSDVRRRRTGSQVASPAGCYAVVRTAESPYPASLQLDADGTVRAAGVARGAWTVDDGDALRVTWNDRAMPPLVLRRDGAGWAGAGVRLTRSEGGACGAP